MEDTRTKSINDFSTLLLQFLDNVYVLCPNTILTNNKSFVTHFISTNSELTIKLFTKNFLKYKNELDNDPKSFLLIHDFSNDVQNIDELNAIKGFNISQIFMFQKIWGTLSENNKDIIIDYIRYLFQLAEIYLNTL